MAMKDRLKTDSRALVFLAIASAKEAYRETVHDRLAADLGPLGMRSPIYRFSDFSTYYDRELGGATWKYFVTLSGQRPAEGIVEVKLATEKIQAEFARPSPEGPQRTVNLDPGYVNGWQVTLTTVKNQAHRICLGRGVFIEVELLYRHGAFHPLPWTYPDYRTEPALRFLHQARSEYLSAGDRSDDRRKQLDDWDV